jgi:hypothetical protein
MYLLRRLWKDVCMEYVDTGLLNSVYMVYVIESYVGSCMNVISGVWKGVFMEFIYTGLQHIFYIDYVIKS